MATFRQSTNNTIGLGSSTADPNNALASLATGGSNQSFSPADLTNAAAIVDQAINQVATLQGNLGIVADLRLPEQHLTACRRAWRKSRRPESDIQDANFAAETASLTQAQILVQAGTSVLSIANSRPQSVLSLLPH